MGAKKRKYVKSPKSFRKIGEKTRGKGRHKPKKFGDRISFLIPRGKKGRRVSGKVIEVNKQFYNVLYKSRIYKVNRKSILYSLGYYTGRVTAGMVELARTTYVGIKHEHAKAQAFIRMKERGITRQIEKYKRKGRKRR